jgi:hypothetical protein
MIAATLEEQKRAKIRFFAVYAASVVLIVVIVFSLWRNDSTDSAATTQAALPVNNGTLLQADALLHDQVKILDNAYSAALSAGKTGVPSQSSNLQSAESALKNTLDSLEKEAAGIKDAQQKAAVITMVANFRNSAETRSALMSTYTALLADTSRSIVSTVQNPASGTDTEMQELKSILVEKEEKVAALEKRRLADLAEKDKVILSLQSRVAQKSNGPAQPVTSAGDSDREWRQKYAKLKTSYDNIAGQNNALTKSYKTIVDDNRRLLSQLQAARKQ